VRVKFSNYIIKILNMVFVTVYYIIGLGVFVVVYLFLSENEGV